MTMVAMKIIHGKSLSTTLDVINESFFFGRALTASQKELAAKWIASRQGLPGSYGNMFSPAEQDHQGIRVFTGERVRSGAATGHILGEEACRALILLNVKNSKVREALDRGTAWVRQNPDKTTGMYCCGICSCSLWRNLLTGVYKDGEARLVAGMKALKANRKGQGQWRRFPFYYTLLALEEMNHPLARAEMRYTAPICERNLRRKEKEDIFSHRRRVLMERVLEKC
jgi:hypothetical protein